MKKKLLSVVLSAAMVSGILAGCGEAAPAANDTAATPATEAGEEAPAEEAAPADAGSGKVYLLNFKPETDEVWQELASTYT